jgi:hypothetical protein
MTGSVPPRADLFVQLLDEQVASAASQPLDDAILTGGDYAPPAVSEDPFHRNRFTLVISRGQALDFGLAEPTPQEAADRAAESARWRVKRAAAEARQAEWFAGIRAEAGPLGQAMLDLHVPDAYGDCEGCGFEQFAGLAWPCATVLAAAEAAGTPEPDSWYS